MHGEQQCVMCCLTCTDLLVDRIYNPLSGISKDDLYERVLRFCQEYGFEDHIETFQKGALVAQRPKDFENLPELVEEDKYHLRREYTRMSPFIRLGIVERTILTLLNRQMASSWSLVLQHWIMFSRFCYPVS